MKYSTGICYLTSKEKLDHTFNTYMFITRSLLEKAGYVPDLENINFSKLQEKEAVETLKLLYRFNEFVTLAADKTRTINYFKILNRCSTKF